jgi:hypothetical protein
MSPLPLKLLIELNVPDAGEPVRFFPVLGFKVENDLGGGVKT